MTIPNVKILVDNELRMSSTGATTATGSAQNKGTATDLLLTLIIGQDGATAVTGTLTPIIQGSNSTNSGFTTVTADKGTLPATTNAATVVSVHAAQLQFQYYRVQVTSSGAATADITAVWNFMNIQDSFDNTVQ
jgi:hypothetical protein